MKISIIYEDNHLLVVDKPVNIPVQADSSGDIDLLTLLKKDIKVRYQKPGNVFLGLVHRLDRPVGGVMVFARTSKAASRLSDAIRKNRFERDYLAIVRGVPDENQGILEHYLFKDTKKNKVHAVSANHAQAKKAQLAYKVTYNTKQLSLLSIRLYTGRSHQIRVQLSTLGVPLYGDQKYGQQVNSPGQQIALKAHTLSFPHPTTKEIMRFESNSSMEYPWDIFNFT